jgi:hypothetical protein
LIWLYLTSFLITPGQWIISKLIWSKYLKLKLFFIRIYGKICHCKLQYHEIVCTVIIFSTQDAKTGRKLPMACTSSFPESVTENKR